MEIYLRISTPLFELLSSYLPFKKIKESRAEILHLRYSRILRISPDKIPFNTRRNYRELIEVYEKDPTRRYSAPPNSDIKAGPVHVYFETLFGLFNGPNLPTYRPYIIWAFEFLKTSSFAQFIWEEVLYYCMTDPKVLELIPFPLEFLQGPDAIDHVFVHNFIMPFVAETYLTPPSTKEIHAFFESLGVLLDKGMRVCRYSWERARPIRDKLVRVCKKKGIRRRGILDFLTLGDPFIIN